MEIWKKINGYANYEVSNEGRIRVIPHFNGRAYLKGMTRKLLTDKHGYKVIRLYNESGGKEFKVHRLVAMAFIPNPENKPHIDHIDRNVANNNVENLRWVTASENQRNPLTREYKKTSEKYKERNKKISVALMGIKRPRGKDVLWHKDIEIIDTNGNVVGLFHGRGEIERQLGIPRYNVQNSMKRDMYVGGYKFRYAQ